MQQFDSFQDFLSRIHAKTGMFNCFDSHFELIISAAILKFYCNFIQL